MNVLIFRADLERMTALEEQMNVLATWCSPPALCATQSNIHNGKGFVVCIRVNIAFVQDLSMRAVVCPDYKICSFYVKL